MHDAEMLADLSPTAGQQKALDLLNTRSLAQLQFTASAQLYHGG
jgi:hypothetical protein